MPRQTIQPEGLFDSRPWGFSQVAISEPGRIVHVAGQVGWDAEGKTTAFDLEGQFRQALEHVSMAVKSAGGSTEDIQMLRFYVCDFKPGSDAAIIATVLTEVFGTDNPRASSWIGVQSLAQPEYLVEVEAVAVIVSGTSSWSEAGL